MRMLTGWTVDKLLLRGSLGQVRWAYDQQHGDSTERVALAIATWINAWRAAAVACLDAGLSVRERVAIHSEAKAREGELETIMGEARASSEGLPWS